MLTVLLAVNNLSAQVTNVCEKTTEGKEFWFGFMENRIYRDEYHTVLVTVAARQNTSFRITIGPPGAPAYNRSFNVLADSSLTVALPWRLAETFGSEIIRNTGIQLISDFPVSVYAVNWDPNSTDVAVIHPVQNLGNEYFAICYEPYVDRADPQSGNGRNSQFLIVATEDNTIVNIKPSKVTDKLLPKDTVIQRVLNRGEVFQVQSENNLNLNGQGDLTGSYVTASKPVAFFSGNLSTTVPRAYRGWDHLYEHIPQVQSWGREYLTAPLKTRIADIFRVLAARNKTTVQISGEPVVYLDAGQFFEFKASEPKHILSDQPLLVAQFSQSRDVDSTATGRNGDPFMIVLNPVNRLIKNAVFQTYGVPNNFTDSIYPGIQTSYVNIIMPTANTSGIMLDKQPVSSAFQPHVVHGWSYAQIELSKGSHKIENIGNNDGFMAYVYGFGGFESYGFSAGYNFDVQLDLGENIEFFVKDTLLLCFGDTLVLDAGSQFDYYKWNTGANTQTIKVVGEQLYWVEARTNDGCILRDSVVVYQSKPVADLGARYREICFPKQVLLSAGDGYDKYIWQNENDNIISTKQNLLTGNDGEYRLTVVDNYRCVARDTMTLKVFPVPEIKILGDSLVCGSTSAKLSVSISGTPDYIWNIPGNYSWSVSSPDVVISDESRFSVDINVLNWGDYFIFYRLITINGCDTTIQFPIRFHPQPVNDFVIDEDIKCSGYSKILRFTGAATKFAFFDWNLNGRLFLDTLDVANRVYLISEGTRQPVDKPVTLVINDKGCLSETVSRLVTNANPNFTMEADVTRGCDSLTVNFSSSNLTSNNVEFVWTINDSEKVWQQNFTKKFITTGAYKVNLTISNLLTQCKNSFTVDKMIKVFPTPVAKIDAKTEVCYPEKALLVYKNHIDSTFYYWDFNNKLLSGYGHDTVIMIMDNPFEKVKLTVSEFGCMSNTAQKVLKRKPVFDFVTENQEGCQPYSVEVFASSTDNHLTYTWITDSLPYPTGNSNLFHFNGTGKFNISLIARSGETGCADTLIKPGWITVYRNPYAKFEADYPVALSDNSTISFINYSERAASYLWEFGDGETSTLFEPVHTYREIGDFKARLFAQSLQGCTDTFEMEIKIIPSVVYAPNAFRPGSNIAKNQSFMPVSAGVDNTRFNLKIFNRWGNLVFESNSTDNKWDGKLRNGKDAPQGNYMWISNYFDIQGIEHNEKGQVLLLR